MPGKPPPGSFFRLISTVPTNAGTANKIDHGKNSLDYFFNQQKPKGNSQGSNAYGDSLQAACEPRITISY